MKTIVLGIIIKDGKILIGKKREGPHPINLGGKWHIIGGKVEEKESVEEALKREIKEETSLEIEIIDKIGEKIIKDSEGNVVKIVTFLCEAKDGEPMPKSDLIDIKLVDVDELFESICEESRTLLPENTKEILKKYFKN